MTTLFQIQTVFQKFNLNNDVQQIIFFKIFYDFLFKIPYALNSEEKSFTVEVYTTEGVIKREVLLKQKAS